MLCYISRIGKLKEYGKNEVLVANTYTEEAIWNKKIYHNVLRLSVSRIGSTGLVASTDSLHSSTSSEA